MKKLFLFTILVYCLSFIYSEEQENKLLTEDYFINFEWSVNEKEILSYIDNIQKKSKNGTIDLELNSFTSASLKFAFCIEVLALLTITIPNDTIIIDNSNTGILNK